MQFKGLVPVDRWTNLVPRLVRDISRYIAHLVSKHASALIVPSYAVSSHTAKETVGIVVVVNGKKEPVREKSTAANRSSIEVRLL